VARAGVGARPIDLFEDDRRFRDVQAAAAVLFRNQRGKPPGVGQRLDEGVGITGALVDFLPILAVELTAQLADCLTIFLILV
jgi:hypothetical protein